MTELHSPNTELISPASNINEKFKNGGEAWEVLLDIRKFPKPIVVDFNNVIANNREPFIVNPEARSFIDKLSEIGNIFIATIGGDWNFVHEFLNEHELWKPGMVIMVAQNFDFLTYNENHMPWLSEKATELRKEFTEKSKDIGRDFEKYALEGARGSKRIAPIFDKTFDIPILDDAENATRENPGMLGICVKAFDPDGNQAVRRELI